MNIAPDIITATTTKDLPQLEPIPGTRLKRLTADFWAYSARLKRWILIPKGFIYDEESTPWRGGNPIAGLIHDYLSRFDSKPVVTKWEASCVYQEFMLYEDGLNVRNLRVRVHDAIWRQIKSKFVGVICPDCVYWRLKPVTASVEEMSGR